MTNPPTNTDRPSVDDAATLECRIGDETVVETVLSAVRAVTDAGGSRTSAELVGGGEASETLPPLYDVVDPDALAKLSSESVGDDVEVTFPYAGCSVTVTGGETVLVRKHSSPTE